MRSQGECLHDVRKRSAGVWMNHQWQWQSGWFVNGTRGWKIQRRFSGINPLSCSAFRHNQIPSGDAAMNYMGHGVGLPAFYEQQTIVDLPGNIYDYETE